MTRKKIFLMSEDRSFFIDEGKDVNTEFGIIKATQLKRAKRGSALSTHKGKRFFVVEPTMEDLSRKIIRLPQIITLKDLGSVLTYGGLRSDSKILDVGTGSGFAACVMGEFARNGKVISYEIRKDFARVAKKNVELFGLDNVKIINTDIKKGVGRRGFDFALIDLPEPWSVMPVISPSVAVGGMICSYVPSIIQVEKLLRSIKGDLKIIRVIQNLQINWKNDVKRDILRPETSGLIHTGFLVFLRRIG
jgi:tRNA (adenine57-N1/adenine58-N1)-methyltransferase